MTSIANNTPVLRFADLARMALLRKPASALSLLQPTAAAAAAAHANDPQRQRALAARDAQHHSAQVNTPAISVAASLPLRLATAVVVTVLSWSERARLRNELNEMDDRALRDVGLSRADVIHERSKAFWQS